MLGSNKLLLALAATALNLTAFTASPLSSAYAYAAHSETPLSVPQACENMTLIRRTVTVSRDNPIEVITTPAAAKDCPVTMKVTQRWGSWEHPLFPEITKDPDVSVRFGTTAGSYFPRPAVKCSPERVCSTSYEGTPLQVKKEPVYYLVRLEYSFLRMVINYLPFMGTDTIECAVEMTYFPCTGTPFLTLEAGQSTGFVGQPAVFTAVLHNWDLADEANPDIAYEWYIEGIKRYESKERATSCSITHVFDSAGDKTVRVHVVVATAAGTVKPLFKEQLTYKVRQ